MYMYLFPEGSNFLYISSHLGIFEEYHCSVKYEHVMSVSCQGCEIVLKRRAVQVYNTLSHFQKNTTPEHHAKHLCRCLT